MIEEQIQEGVIKTNFRHVAAWMLAVCLLCAGPCAWAEEEFAVEGVARTADIPYLEDGEKDHLLDVYQPEGASQPTPVIVEIHGGGFIGGSKEINMVHVFNVENVDFPESQQANADAIAYLDSLCAK